MPNILNIKHLIDVHLYWFKRLSIKLNQAILQYWLLWASITATIVSSLDTIDVEYCKID